MTSEGQQTFRLTQRGGEWRLIDGSDHELKPIDQLFVDSFVPFLPGIVGGPQTYALSAVVESGGETAHVLQGCWLEREPSYGLVFNGSRIDEDSPVIRNWCASLPLRGVLTGLGPGKGRLVAGDRGLEMAVHGEPLEVFFAIAQQSGMTGPFTIHASVGAENPSTASLGEIVVLLPHVAWHYRA